MVYVQRKGGAICALYAQPQPQPDGSVLTDPAPLADNDPEVVAFLNPPPDPRLVAIDDSIKTQTLGTVTPKTVAELKAMSAAEYSAWFDANFATAALVIGFVKRLGLIVIRRVL